MKSYENKRENFLKVKNVSKHGEFKVFMYKY